MTRPLRSSILSSFALAAGALLGCGGGTAKPGGPGMGMAGGAGRGMAGMPGSAGAAGAGAGGAGGTMMTGPMGHAGMMGMGMTGAGGVIVVGVPTPGTPGTVFPGGGPNGSTPLAPGCTPASAHECPSASGKCATSSTSNPTGTTGGSICFYGPITTTTTTTTTPAPLAATIEYLHETAGGQEYYRFRIIFDPTFVDNTYGVNAIGWGTKGHTFKDLVGSDHAELSLFDGTPTLVSMFDLDYITADTSAACAYGALGVSGGEGKVLVGDAKYILASTTSLDRDLNGCGYCKNAACGGDCTVDSPATDAMYTPNAAAPNWDFRVIYEVWVDAAVFASKGLGGASITFVHASPSKASSNTVSVTPRPCGGGGCPNGTMRVETSTGTSCQPDCPGGTYQVEVETSTGTMKVCSLCPAGSAPVTTGDAATCMVCPTGTTVHVDSEGSYSCQTGCPGGTYQVEVETSTGTMKVCSPCPAGSRPVATSDGDTCMACPTGTTVHVDSEGSYSCVATTGE